MPTIVKNDTNQHAKQVIVALVVLTIVLAVPAYTYGTRFRKSITVKRTYTGSSRRNGTQYYVDTDDGSVYQVEQTVLLGFYKAAELWNTLTPGTTYEVKAYGMRVGILGMFPNIYEAKQV